MVFVNYIKRGVRVQALTVMLTALLMPAPVRR
nr:MAG TPA: hypothetical protein [Caudoviricetes sp.]